MISGSLCKVVEVKNIPTKPVLYIGEDSYAMGLKGNFTLSDCRVRSINGEIYVIGNLKYPSINSIKACIWNKSGIVKNIISNRLYYYFDENNSLAWVNCTKGYFGSYSIGNVLTPATSTVYFMSPNCAKYICGSMFFALTPVSGHPFILYNDKIEEIPINGYLTSIDVVITNR